MTTIRIAPSHADMARRMLTTPRRGKLDWLWQWDATRTGWAWLSPWGVFRRVVKSLDWRLSCRVLRETVSPLAHNPSGRGRYA
jgi:hypothetical protein